MTIEEQLQVEAQAEMSGVPLGEVLAAVSRRFPGMTPKEQQVAAAAAAKTAAAKSADGTLTRPQKILIRRLKDAPKAILDKIKSGGMNFKDLDYYFRKQITAGITRILDDTTKVKVGSSSLDGNTLKPGTVALIHKIRIAYANDAGTDETVPKYSNTATLPAKVLNADIVFYINGSERLRMPASRFFNEGGSYAGVQGNADSVDLNSPILWMENEELKIELETASAGALGANNHFLEVRPIMVAISSK